MIKRDFGSRNDDRNEPFRPLGTSKVSKLKAQEALRKGTCIQLLANWKTNELN